MQALLFTEAHVLRALRAHGLAVNAVRDWTVAADELLSVQLDDGIGVCLLPSQWKPHATPVEVERSAVQP
jgi:hypothetical protein